MIPMPSLLDYLAQIPTPQRAALIGAGFLAVWTLELAFGASRYARLRHAATNLPLWGTTLLVNAAVSGVTLGASFAVSNAHFGLLRWLAPPTWLEVLLSIALLDLLTAYVHHRVTHAIPFLWQFHVVHHSDPHVDSTTALRHSPVEAVMRSAVTLLGVVALGVAPGVLVAYQTIALLSAQWIHADLRLPARLDRALSLVFVSPGMHRVHHHRSLPETDANYSTIFSLWDRLFGTWCAPEQRAVVFGVDVVPESTERERSAARVLRLALFPAREGYRRRPLIASPVRPSASSAPVVGSGT
jgi:sterol desaturase/sphingolipid hydroxylase (fatty acid hydroxylase superfamily)